MAICRHIQHSRQFSLDLIKRARALCVMFCQMAGNVLSGGLVLFESYEILGDSTVEG